jgi:two-component system sensor kinase FixL
MLGAIHGLVWLRQRDDLASLMFCLLAASTAGMAVCELWMMNTTETDVFGMELQLYNVLRWFVTVSLVGFVHFHLRSGRVWLEISVIGLRTAGLLLNLLVSPNTYYSSIQELHRIPFLGQTVTIVEGIPNPLMIVSQVSLLLLAAYLVDATWRGYMQGNQKRALRVGSSMVFFVLALSLQTMLVLWGVINTPIVASLFFLGIVVTMGLELSHDKASAARLAKEIQLRERELRHERELRDAIFASAPGLIYLQSQDGRILRWNAQFEKITLYSHEEIKGMKIDELFRTENRSVYAQAAAQAFSEGIQRIEMDLIRKDGEPMRHFFTTVRVEIGGEQLLVGIGIDVTAERARAIEASRQKEELAHLSRIATISELSSSLAHELNQPLAIILSNAQAAQRLIIGDQPDIAELKEILNDIVSADIRAADVIKRLRSILGRGEPVFEPVSPQELFDQVLKLLKPDLESEKVTIIRRHPKRLPSVPADRIPVEQALMNLIKNACDAMAGNGDRRKILTLACSREGDSLRFSIRDNGCGLSDDAEKIFQPFHTTKRNGLGLGLAICQTIIKAHGGELWAEPNKTQGATFSFKLPINHDTP